MRKLVRLGLVVAVVTVSAGVFAQEAEKPDRRKRAGAMKGVAHVRGILAAMRILRATKDIVPELDAAQKEKYDAALAKFATVVKEAGEQFEIDLADIFTGAQMETFKAAKDAPPTGREGRTPRKRRRAEDGE